MDKISKLRRLCVIGNAPESVMGMHQKVQVTMHEFCSWIGNINS